MGRKNRDFVFVESVNWKTELEDYVETDLRKIGFRNVDWYELVEDRIQWSGFVTIIIVIRLP
jgi:hypothetical protein